MDDAPAHGSATNARVITRIDLGPLSTLGADEARLVRIGGPPPKQGLILCRAGDGVRVYWNVCQHLPIPLDGGLGQLPAGRELVCVSHGARFEREAGLCTSGPCRGKWLEAVPFEVDADRVIALVER
ncbi:Rieske 2Fe-2S domain-containing protein [Myxococcota bacterium]|nr:Rieske 2Fe-2S domain-containing protein [Myxococcota bacterium]